MPFRRYEPPSERHCEVALRSRRRRTAPATLLAVAALALCLAAARSTVFEAGNILVAFIVSSHPSGLGPRGAGLRNSRSIRCGAEESSEQTLVKEPEDIRTDSDEEEAVHAVTNASDGEAAHSTAKSLKPLFQEIFVVDNRSAKVIAGVVIAKFQNESERAVDLILASSAASTKSALMYTLLYIPSSFNVGAQVLVRQSCGRLRLRIARDYAPSSEAAKGCEVFRVGQLVNATKFGRAIQTALSQSDNDQPRCVKLQFIGAYAALRALGAIENAGRFMGRELHFSAAWVHKANETSEAEGASKNDTAKSDAVVEVLLAPL